MLHARNTPGQDFFQARLQRASAVPPHQRSPEVAAFVASEGPPAQVAALLPLTRQGRQALPARDADTQRRFLLAHVLALGDVYTAPGTMHISYGDAGERLAAYGMEERISRRGSGARLDPTDGDKCWVQARDSCRRRGACGLGRRTACRCHGLCCLRAGACRRPMCCPVLCRRICCCWLA